MKVKELIEELMKEDLEAEVFMVHFEQQDGTFTSWPVENSIFIINSATYADGTKRVFLQ